MKTALAWVKDALSSKALAPALAHYLVKDGMLHATDGRMTAAHPFPDDRTFCVAGKEFGALIERLPDPIGIAVADDAVTLRNGRLNGTVRTIDPNDWPLSPTTGERHLIPERLLPALKQLRPFVSDNAARPFAMCIRVAYDTLYATNNVVVVAAPEIDLDEAQALIPSWAIDFILARGEGLTHWSHTDSQMTFYWSNGAWMSTRLVDDTFPAAAENIINQAGFAGTEITPEWRKDFNAICELLDGSTIVLHKDRMSSELNPSRKLTVENETGTYSPVDLEYSAWSTEFLQPVIAVATHWAPDRYPKPTPFRGEGIVGVIIGRRINNGS